MIFRQTILNARAGYAYLNMPKAACTAVKSAIAQHLGLPAVGSNPEMPDELRAFVIPGGVLPYPGLVRWTLVRHPLDRLVSCWASKCSDPPPDPDCGPILLGMTGWTFRQFIMHVCGLPLEKMDPHFAPQWELAHMDGMRLIDEAYRLEDCVTVWPWLQTRFPGLPDLPRMNETPHGHYLEHYDRDMLAAAMRRYRCDFTLGYTLRGVCPPTWEWGQC